MKSLNTYIAESKTWDSKKFASEFVKMMIDDNNSETVEDDIEIFLDEVEEELYKIYSKDQPAFDRFRDAIVKHVKKY